MINVFRCIGEGNVEEGETGERRKWGMERWGKRKRGEEGGERREEKEEEEELDKEIKKMNENGSITVSWYSGVGINML